MLAMWQQEPPEFNQAVLSGIVVTEFQTPQGQITVYLPDDIAPGDTISGTVYVVPKGTGAEHAANEKLLTGFVLSIDGVYAAR